MHCLTALINGQLLVHLHRLPLWHLASFVDSLCSRADLLTHACPSLCFKVRHGERSDDAIPGWEKTAARPWDPPLTEKGFQQAFNVGQQLRSEGYKIDRVVISPFMRCLQTAGEIIKALTDGAAEDETVQDSKGKGAERAQEGAARGPASKVRAHIDYGLTELLNARAIRNPPRSGADLHSKDTWLLPEEQLHALLPPGVLDESLGTQGKVRNPHILLEWSGSILTIALYLHKFHLRDSRVSLLDITCPNRQGLGPGFLDNQERCPDFLWPQLNPLPFLRNRNERDWRKMTLGKTTSPLICILELF